MNEVNPFLAFIGVVSLFGAVVIAFIYIWNPNVVLLKTILTLIMSFVVCLSIQKFLIHREDEEADE